jgi:hypothetical protein
MLFYLVGETAKRFCSDINNTKFAVKDGEYFQLLAHYFLYKTSRTRFPGEGNSPVTLINKSKTKELYNFVTSHCGQLGVYVHGPQGVGKSYSLYQVCALLLT